MKPKEAAIATGEDETARVWDWLLEQRKSVHDRVLPPPVSSATQQAFLDLYSPFANRRETRSIVVAHLGQSIDGFIATQDGDSYYVNGPQNLDHMHRMRALADAVVVGAGTVAADDPSLTTRRVKGPNATRVILEGRRRLGDSHRVFSDSAAPTLLVRNGDDGAAQRHGNAEVIGLPGADSEVDPSMLIAVPRRRSSRPTPAGCGARVDRSGPPRHCCTVTNASSRLPSARSPALPDGRRPAVRLRSSGATVA